MRCPACQHENPAGARFCNGCGAGLQLTCASCGHVNAAGSRFCNGCGAKLGEGAPAAAPTRFPSPDAYTPKHLAEKILTSKAALEGERKQVTVLFADLKGSMELLADRDPEDARKILDPVIEHMMEAVHRYEGTVNQVMGDGIMALFGAPLAHEDHAVRACYAALRMQESVTRYAEGVRKVEGIPVRIRVGLNSGNVVVRAIGSDLHMDYTAVGQTTHLAARMEQIADPGSILITADTWDLVEGFIVAKSLGDVPVKGLAARVNVYEVVGADAARSRLHVAAGRGLTRFVGRDPEIERLRVALTRAKTGNGQIVAVVGEPGVGKSRLYWEFTRSPHITDALVLESRSVSYGKATSYLPVIDLLKAYFQIDARDDRRRMREKITGKVLGLDESMRSALPALLALLDAASDDPVWQGLDASQRRQRTLDAVRQLILRESREQPLIVMFEDLHWIDAETQGLLDLLIESVPTAPLLMLVNYRPEYQHRWGNKTYYQQLQIAPLPAEDAAVLLDDLVGPDPSLRPLKDLLIARTAGNPFFLEESIRTLIETGALAGERGKYQLTHTSSSIQIPATVQSVLAARIDRLDPETKRVLQCAAVIGKDVPFVLLRAIAGLDETALRQELSALQVSEFVYEIRLFPESEYTFKHALTLDVAYAGLTHARRQALDAAIVEAIEHLFAERLGEHVERLASHAFRGEVWPKAAGYLQRVAERAMERSAYEQAGLHLTNALRAMEHLTEDSETLERFVDLKLTLTSTSRILGDLDQAEAHARAALATAERLRDHARITLCCTTLVQTLDLSARAFETLSLVARALEAADASGDERAQLAANVAAGMTHMLLGNFRDARRHFEVPVTALRNQSIRWTSLPRLLWATAITSHTWLCMVLVELGAFDDALELARIANEQADTRRTFQPLPRFVRAYVRFRQGQPGARLELEQGLAVTKEANHVNMLAPCLAALGSAHIQEGTAVEGIALLEEAISEAESHNRSQRALFLSQLSGAYLAAERADDALRAARDGLRGARERHERSDEAWCLRELAEALAFTGETDAAARHFEEAMAIADDLGMRPLAAHCHLGLGKLYRGMGKWNQARERLGAAVRMYRDMDMRLWLEQAEVEITTLA